MIPYMPRLPFNDPSPKFFTLSELTDVLGPPHEGSYRADISADPPTESRHPVDSREWRCNGEQDYCIALNYATTVPEWIAALKIESPRSWYLHRVCSKHTNVLLP
jgi:hypothetical protein